MKNFFEYSARHKFDEVVAVEHLFCTNGNGISLDLKGYISSNYRGKEAHVFGEPRAFTHIYPWSNTEDFQPFRKFAGCRDVGFKETVEFFLACLDLTPDDLPSVYGPDHKPDILPWKENRELIRSILLDTPTITDEFESINDGPKFIESLKGKDTSYGNKWDNPSDGDDSVRKVWFFDAQWSDCPEEVEAEVRQAWHDYELGNDVYFFKTQLDEELFEAYPRIYFWLEHKGVQKGEKVLVHWWW